MDHEEIILDKDNWSAAHGMVQYNLNRCVNNIHRERDRVNSVLMQESLDRKSDVGHVQTGVARVDGICNSNSTRIAVLEAKMIVYAAIGGAIGMALMHWVLGHI